MKTLGLVVLGFFAFILLGGMLTCGWAVSTRNDMATGRNNVKNKAANIQVQVQRRYDLLPNLESAVKGAIEHEQDLQVGIAKARSAVEDAKKLPFEAVKGNPEMMKAFLAAQAQVNQALVNIKVQLERYPENKANAVIVRFMDEVAGTENRIKEARLQYNTAVQEQNDRIVVWPASIVANNSGFKEEASFEAQPEAEKAPKANISIRK